MSKQCEEDAGIRGASGSRAYKHYIFQFLLILALLCSGCATPIGVISSGPDYGYAQIDQNALNSSEPSSHTSIILYRYDLGRLNAKSPVNCLMELHKHAVSDHRRDTLFALSELCFMLGKEGCEIDVDGRTLAPKNFFAASAVYAYLFLFGSGDEAVPDPFDRRFRIACDFYNRSLGYIVTEAEGRGASGSTEWQLPVGSIVMHRGVEGSDIDIPLNENETFVFADRFQIRGLSVRNRNAGIGAPIVITRQKKEGARIGMGAAATVFVRIQGGLADFTSGKLQGTAEIYSAFARDHIEVEGRRIPLEQDITTQIAYSLNDPFYQKVEKMMFRFGQAPVAAGIYPSQPYQAGKIPVLFVHGTMSSPIWWAEMWNTLMSDKKLRGKYQFWFYLYDSAKPVALSAVHLRTSIEEIVKKMDPEDQDPMLRQMVVIGHSQGGLLTKLTATQTGDAMLRAITGKSLAELKLSPEDEKIVSQMAVFEPLKEVKRVVFISTPHRGSYQAGGLVRKLARNLLELPKQALQTAAEVVNLAPKIGPDVKMASTSLDTMSPDNKALHALAEIPVAPSIKAHSIIPVKGDSVPPDGNDGVVKYTSAHIAGVESELVVRGGHSCQTRPAAIEEVRRILLLHLEQVPESPSPRQ